VGEVLSEVLREERSEVRKGRLSMHILLVADGRSPTTRGWVQGLAALQHQVTLVSTYPCNRVAGVSEQFLVPVAFGALAGSQAAAGLKSARAPVGAKRMLGQARKLVLEMRYLLGPLTLPFFAPRLRAILQKTRPDIVHALRIPFEGMLAAAAQPEVPLVVSIWGNDLTLHARGSAAMRRRSMRVLRRANGLLADAGRDLRLGQAYGFSPQRPMMVLPGAGGIDLLGMYRIRAQATETLLAVLPRELYGPDRPPLVVNPRGFRPGSVRNDTFFEAIPLVRERDPNVMFICTGMAGQPDALRYVQRWKLQDSVVLTPFLPQAQLWSLFQKADVNLSVSSHDGTPNSLLESMACGCFPVAGDVESIREWITPGVNGLLVEPGKSQSVAEAVLLALDQPTLRSAAAEANLEIIRSRAETGFVRSQMEVFYRRVIGE
jgi:glycosyltransferase involved in cell wall biosynthesis